MAVCRSDAPGASLGREERQQQLVAVFQEFDLDGSGVIEAGELLQLGQMRRRLGQKGGEWSEAKNNRLIRRMDANGDGEISQDEFSTHFERALPREAREFETTVRQFMEVAKACRAKKEALRAAPRASSAPRPRPAPVRSTRTERLARSSAGYSDTNSRTDEERAAALAAVFREFDFEGDDDGISIDELFALGMARRTLGQKQGEWTREMTAKLMKRIGTNAHGNITQAQFVAYFKVTLAQPRLEFDKTIEDFKECARACREKRSAAAQPSAQPCAGTEPMLRTELDSSSVLTSQSTNISTNINQNTVVSTNIGICPRALEAPGWGPPHGSEAAQFRSTQVKALCASLAKLGSMELQLGALEQAVSAAGLPRLTSQVQQFAAAGEWRHWVLNELG